MDTVNPGEGCVVPNGSESGIVRVAGLLSEAQTSFVLLIVPVVEGLFKVETLGTHNKLGSASVMLKTVESGPHSVDAEMPVRVM